MSTNPGISPESPKQSIEDLNAILGQVISSKSATSGARVYLRIDPNTNMIGVTTDKNQSTRNMKKVAKWMNEISKDNFTNVDVDKVKELAKNFKLIKKGNPTLNKLYHKLVGSSQKMKEAYSRLNEIAQRDNDVGNTAREKAVKAEQGSVTEKSITSHEEGEKGPALETESNEPDTVKAPPPADKKPVRSGLRKRDDQGNFLVAKEKRKVTFNDKPEVRIIDNSISRAVESESTQDSEDLTLVEKAFDKEIGNPFLKEMFHENLKDLTEKVKNNEITKEEAISEFATSLNKRIDGQKKIEIDGETFRSFFTETRLPTDIFQSSDPELNEERGRFLKEERRHVASKASQLSSIDKAKDKEKGIKRNETDRDTARKELEKELTRDQGDKEEVITIKTPDWQSVASDLHFTKSSRLKKLINLSKNEWPDKQIKNIDVDIPVSQDEQEAMDQTLNEDSFKIALCQYFKVPADNFGLSVPETNEERPTSTASEEVTATGVATRTTAQAETIKHGSKVPEGVSEKEWRDLESLLSKNDVSLVSSDEEYLVLKKQGKDTCRYDDGKYFLEVTDQETSTEVELPLSSLQMMYKYR